jgi:hypothetical protein
MMEYIDFRSKLEEQLRFLETSCREYDAGRRDEAVRLATQMRIVFHDAGKSVSLLRHLKSKSINLLSTAVKNPAKNPSGYWPGLIEWELDPHNSIFACRPKFDATRQARRLVPFNYWWESETIYQFGHRRLRRGDLVLAAANKDGGAHVDARLLPDCEWLVDGSGWKMTLQPDGQPEREVRLMYAHQASIRQIAHEVLHSPEIRKLAGRQ